MRKHLPNVIGICIGLAILIFGSLFALWQLDIIVSGPVWWEYSPTGPGWSWNGPGAYQHAYFQCFLWKTSVGVAYDTLFLIAYALPIIGAVIMAGSIWFWEDECKCVEKCH